MNVQFGCGGNRLNGWINHDSEVDVTKLPLPYMDNCLDMVLAEHLPEHLCGPDCLRFFIDVHRILRPGGTFRVCVPVIGPKLKRDHAQDLILNHGHLIMFNENLLITVLWSAGFDIERIKSTSWKECDGHYKAIGREKDLLETCRVEAYKALT